MATEQLPRDTFAASGALESALARVARRMRLARWVRHASRGALIGTGVALVAALLDHFDALPDGLPLPAAVAVPIGIGVGVGTLTAFLQPISPMAVARAAELRLGLKERLSSALEFERTNAASDDPEARLIRRMQQQDAQDHAARLNASAAAPIRLPWETKALPVAVLLLILALILPNLPIFVPPAVARERAIVHKAGQKIIKSAHVLQKQADAQHLPQTKRIAQNMQKLGQKMAHGHLDKKQAMVKMAQLTKQIQDLQRQIAHGDSGAGQPNKSLADAGRQLAQALQNQTGAQSASGSGNQAQGANSAGAKAKQAGGQGASKGDKDKTDSHGFNLPGKQGQSNPSNSNSPHGQPSSGTPEMQKAAQAMQQGNAQSLSEQLRKLADRVQKSPMTPGQQQQAAQDLQNLANALQGTGMPETQKHAQAAADAMKRGDQKTASQEMRKAADSAEREAQQQADQQGMQDAQGSLQGGENEMAGANSPSDIPDAPPGEGSGQGQGQGRGKGHGQGQGGGDGQGNNPYGANGKHGSGKGTGGSGGGGGIGGKPGNTGMGNTPEREFDPKTGQPKNGKSVRLYFGKPQNPGPSQAGKSVKTRPGPGGATPSSVPYYRYAPAARKSAEEAMEKEDIPPSYKKGVQDYFNSLQPGGNGR